MASERQVIREGPFGQFIPEAVKVGNIIYLSGQVSIDEQGNPVGEGDIFAQMRQAFAHVKSTLEKLGAGMSDVVDETMLVTDVSAVMADLDQFATVRNEVYGGEPQVSQTLVQVAALFMPALMIEIKCVAIV